MKDLNKFDLNAHLNNSSLPLTNENHAPSAVGVSGANGMTAVSSADVREQVRLLVEHITAHSIDITEGYNNWLSCAFALVDALGEEGRGFFHDISRYNAGYNATECDKKYTSCLRSNGSGIHIATLFQAAKNAGIDISHIARQSTTQHAPCAECANAQASAEEDKNRNSLIINDSMTDEQCCAPAQVAHDDNHHSPSDPHAENTKDDEASLHFTRPF